MAWARCTSRLLREPISLRSSCGIAPFWPVAAKLGDYMRSVPPIVHDVSYPFLMVNRGKRSLSVDLKTPEGQEIVHKLARGSDVVVEQFRPGVMARLRVAYDDLAMMNPRLVYCSFSGYGQTGPYKDLPGHDINFQALAGILGVTTGREDKAPAIPGVPIADLASGFNAALAILAALRVRDRTGRGEFIDVSIYDTAVALMGLRPVVDVSGLWKLQVIAHPAKHATLETRNPTRVPAKGQDTEEILRSLGYTARQIQTLAKKGVVAI